MKQAHYKVDIRWSEEDQAYIARVPELVGVVTDGESYAEAAAAAQEAIELHLESLEAHNEPAPVPASHRKLNGKFQLRMTPQRHEDLMIESERAGKSMNEFLNDLIDATIDRSSLRPPSRKSKVVALPTNRTRPSAIRNTKKIVRKA